MASEVVPVNHELEREDSDDGAAQHTELGPVEEAMFGEPLDGQEQRRYYPDGHHEDQHLNRRRPGPTRVASGRRAGQILLRRIHEEVGSGVASDVILFNLHD